MNSHSKHNCCRGFWSKIDEAGYLILLAVLSAAKYHPASIISVKACTITSGPPTFKIKRETSWDTLKYCPIIILHSECNRKRSHFLVLETCLHPTTTPIPSTMPHFVNVVCHYHYTLIAISILSFHSSTKWFIALIPMGALPGLMMANAFGWLEVPKLSLVMCCRDSFAIITTHLSSELLAFMVSNPRATCVFFLSKWVGCQLFFSHGFSSWFSMMQRNCSISATTMCSCYALYFTW
jgi:hypothetical protein